MNTQAITEDGADALGIGAQLAAARAARSLSVADVAHQLKFSSSQVEALEAERYAQLPDAVFTRGFIRNYARLVGLDPLPLLAAVNSHLSHHTLPVPVLPPPAGLPFPSGRPFRWRRYAVAAALLVASVIVVEIYREDDVATKPLPAAVPSVAAVTPSAPPAAPALSAAAPMPDAAIAPSVHVKVEPAADEHHLTFTFVRESWVEVRDGHGHRLLWQLNPAGSQQKISGPPPLSLVIGNAGNVRLQVDDRLFDLNPYIDVDVARLTLD
ncbi:MAG TPA: helix-turn-helix domain-containing protein [Burkholderiales bacterium]|nr:helix-turn-helix domain-containing protein [Burkholderiales bacterium]